MNTPLIMTIICLSSMAIGLAMFDIAIRVKEKHEREEREKIDKE